MSKSKNLEGGNEARLQGEVTGQGYTGQPTEVTRHHLTVPLSRDEIGLHHWTSRAAKLKLHDYLRSALDEKARRVVTDLIARGKKIPPWVGKLLD